MEEPLEERRESRQIRRRNRGSLFFPIILIALGVIFLLNNLGALPGDLWSNVLRFWPVILIAIGLDSIYRGEGLAGAAFMIGLGAVFLLASLGYLALDVWSVAIRLWPLLLIAIGFDILIGRRSAIASIIGLVVILALLGGALYLFGVRVDRGQAIPGEAIRQELGGASQARITLQPGAGSLHIDELTEPGSLISGTVSDRSGNRITSSSSQDGDVAIYSLSSSGIGVFYPGGGRQWDWDLGVTPEIPLDLRVEMGAGQAEIDLTGLEVSALSAKVAVGEVRVVLPAAGRFRGEVESAIGQIVIMVPRGLAVRVEASTGLANVQAPAGYQNDGSVYTSPGYSTAENRVDLRVSQAIGSVIIQER